MRGFLNTIPVKYEISCHSNKHYLLILSMGRAAWADCFQRPVYRHRQMDGLADGGGFQRTWEEVTQLSWAKSDSVIKTKSLGGSI